MLPEEASVDAMTEYMMAITPSGARQSNPAKIARMIWLLKGLFLQSFTPLEWGAYFAEMLPLGGLEERDEAFGHE